MDKGSVVLPQSPIAAPALSVAKSDGPLRVVIDYRALNGITTKDGYPIARIRDVINELDKADQYSTARPAKRVLAGRVVAQDRWKAALRTRYGTFKFRVMPAWLAGTPFTFQHLTYAIFLKN